MGGCPGPSLISPGVPPLVFGGAGGLFLAQAQSSEAVEGRRDIDEAWAGEASWQGMRTELYDGI